MPPLAGSVGSDALATAIGQVATAAGRDDTLPALTGIRIEIEGDTLTLVATDRYRLAVRELRWNPARPDLSTAVLVPARVLGDTARALTSGAEVSISLGGESLIGFAGAGRQTTTRLLSGEYPKYAALLPSEFSATAELVASSFAEAVKRVALVAERNTPVRLAFSPGQLVLEAGASEDAQAVEVLEAAFDGEDLQIAFNPQYLLDGIGAIDSDTARISFTSPTKPAVITGKTEHEPDYRYVLMPIRCWASPGGTTPLEPPAALRAPAAGLAVVSRGRRGLCGPSRAARWRGSRLAVLAVSSGLCTSLGSGLRTSGLTGSSAWSWGLG